MKPRRPSRAQVEKEALRLFKKVYGIEMNFPTSWFGRDKAGWFALARESLRRK